MDISMPYFEFFTNSNQENGETIIAWVVEQSFGYDAGLNAIFPFRILYEVVRAGR